MIVQVKKDTKNVYFMQSEYNAPRTDKTDSDIDFKH